MQPAHFGRVYAAYGGVFIVLSILWGWKVDKIAPDELDLNWRIGGFDWCWDYYVLASKSVEDI